MGQDFALNSTITEISGVNGNISPGLNRSEHVMEEKGDKLLILYFITTKVLHDEYKICWLEGNAFE